MVTKKQTKRKRPPNNPWGINQYAAGKGLGEKDAAFYMRLKSTDKEKLKEAAKKRGMNLTSWLIAVALEAAEKEVESKR